MKNKLKIFLIIVFLLTAIFYVLSLRPLPKKINYGVSFSKFHSDELKLDWRKVYLALLDDLRARQFRFSAHWPNTEPKDDKFNFMELDFQMEEARKRNASVILAIGRRLPGWPECHEPDWLESQIANRPLRQSESEASKSQKNEEILEYIETVMNRYKDYPNFKYWQVENEPFLTFFSRSACGELDKEFLQKEIDLVKKLDPARPILMTDSGEFGDWLRAYKRGDIFGTSMYLYIWNKIIGPFRYPITPAFFRIKQNFIELLAGKKESLIIELSTEPWLLRPITDTPMEVLLDRMGVDKFNEMIDFAGKTGFDTQYLWGAEWWYWMKEKGHPEFWEKAKTLF